MLCTICLALQICPPPLSCGSVAQEADLLGTESNGRPHPLASSWDQLTGGTYESQEDERKEFRALSPLLPSLRGHTLALTASLYFLHEVHSSGGQFIQRCSSVWVLVTVLSPGPFRFGAGGTRMLK